MLNKGKIANEYGEIIGAYWYRFSTNTFTLRVYGNNREGYTEDGIIQFCNKYNLLWWEE